MAAERVLGSYLKLLVFLFTVVIIIQDNIITFKKQDLSFPQTVSTSLEVLGLASHSTLRPNGRFNLVPGAFWRSECNTPPKGQAA